MKLIFQIVALLGFGLALLTAVFGFPLLLWQAGLAGGLLAFVAAGMTG